MEWLVLRLLWEFLLCIIYLHFPGWCCDIGFFVNSGWLIFKFDDEFSITVLWIKNDSILHTWLILAKSLPFSHLTARNSLVKYQFLLNCWQYLGMSTYFRSLAWRIPWTGEPGGLQSMGFQRVGHGCNNWACMGSISSYHYPLWIDIWNKRGSTMSIPCNSHSTINVRKLGIKICFISVQVT